MDKLLVDHLWVVILVLLLTLPIKAAALWRSARRNHLGWFLTFVILNTLGILELLYIFIFSNWGLKKNQEQEEEKPQVRQAHNSKFSSSSKSRTTIV